MGQSADQKVNEIHRTRVQVEEDMRELRRRLPVPLSGKTIGLLLGGGTAGGLVLRTLGRIRRKRRDEQARTAEVVIRVVDERVDELRRDGRRGDLRRNHRRRDGRKDERA